MTAPCTSGPAAPPPPCAIIGIDCAAQPENVGLALGRLDDGRAAVEQVLVGRRRGSIVEMVLDWWPSDRPVLLALDAPLGWPAALGAALAEHAAGQEVLADSRRLFLRETDVRVWELTGQRPLEVGADRIARTAHAALALLGELRRRTGQAIPLAWGPPLPAAAAAIEVYPAASLAAAGIRARGYKRAEGRDARARILEGVGQFVELPVPPKQLLESDHALDAALCVWAALDFLSGLAAAPEQDGQAAARAEGWIWVRRPTGAAAAAPGSSVDWTVASPPPTASG